MCELEDIEKHTGESVDELVCCIYQLVHQADVGDGIDKEINFEAQHQLINDIPDIDIKLWKSCPKVERYKGLAHLPEVIRTYYAIKCGSAAMCAGKSIYAVHS